MKDLLKPDQSMILGLVLGLFVIPTVLAVIHSKR